MQSKASQTWRNALCAVLLISIVVLTTPAACFDPTPPTTSQPLPTQGKSSKTPDADAADARSDQAETITPDEPSSKLPVAATELGQQLYARHCGACHGEQGDGRGIAAAYLFPKPRDFQAGRFRLVSTSNNVPSRQDLHAVLLRGMPGSSMPPWGHLSLIEREALVDEVMRLRKQGARKSYISFLKDQEYLTDEEIAADDVQQEIRNYVHRFTTPGESSVVPEIGEATDAAMARAKETYAKFGCLQCHGPEGKGDGVQMMVDDEGFPTAPRDFTAGMFKGGADAASLYRRIAYGMPGTPMPSSGQLTPEQMVDLLHYIRAMSTQERRQAAVLNREQIVARKKDSVPAGSHGSGWSDIPAVSLRMTPLWWRNNADPDLQVQAAYDATSIAVRISWKDDKPNLHAASSEAFEDAVAIELYRGDAEPFLGMGGPTSAVDVWFWDADRQGTPLAVEKLYPNSVVDVYPFSEAVVASAELDRDGARTENQPEVSLPARASGNQIVPAGDESGGTSLTGGGPGSSTFRLPGSQHVRATGGWQDGRWTVVMTRPLKLASPDDGVSLRPGDRASVAFAVWDGAAMDRDGKKLITIWQDLILED